MKKQNPKLESTQKKLSKIGPFENFNIWSKVNTKVKVNESQQILVKVNN